MAAYPPEPFEPGDILWINGEQFRSGSGVVGGHWAFKVTTAPIISGFEGWWYVSGWELNGNGDPTQWRILCLPANNPRRVRPYEQGSMPPRHTPEPDDLRGTATGRSWNFPGRIRFPGVRRFL